MNFWALIDHNISSTKTQCFVSTNKSPRFTHIINDTTKSLYRPSITLHLTHAPYNYYKQIRKIIEQSLLRYNEGGVHNINNMVCS